MNYVNEQIIKTFEYLLNLRYKYHSIDTLISSPKNSRILYRINQEKLDKYRSQYNDNVHLISNENKKLYIEEKKTISTQTTFNKEIHFSTDLIHPSVNTLSIISKETSESDISTNSSSISSSSSNTNKTTTKNLNSSSTELSMKTDSNQIQEYKFNDYSSKSQSTNCRVYIRSIARHMFGDNLSDEEQYFNKI